MKVLQHLLGKTKHVQKMELEYDNTMGFLTKDDIQNLRKASMKPRSPHRKDSYKTWMCRDCEHSSFFAVVKCLLCGSDKIEEVTKPSRYQIIYGNDAV